jgi:hypothetical protein
MYTSVYILQVILVQSRKPTFDHDHESTSLDAVPIPNSLLLLLPFSFAQAGPVYLFSLDLLTDH